MTSLLGIVTIALMPSKLVRGVNKMKKKEILQRSRNENINEYEEKILNDSHRFGILIISIISIIFMIIKAIHSDIQGLENGIPSFDYAAILMGYVSYQFIYKFIKTRENNSLIAGIAFGLICIVFIFLYINNL